MIKLHKQKSHYINKPQFWFTINGKNGQVIATSELYTRKANAKKGMEAVVDAVSYREEYWVDLTGDLVIKKKKSRIKHWK